MSSIPISVLFLALSWTAGFWLVCVGIPLGIILNQVDFTSSWSQFRDPVILAVVRATLWQGLWSTLISSALGLILGLWVGKVTGGRGKLHARLQTLLSIPYGVPTLVAAMAWVGLLGRSGILRHLGFQFEWAYSLKAVILAHVFLNIPLVALLVSQARAYVSEDQLEAARTLGAGWVAELRWVIWPQIKWAFASASAQVMALCAMSFSLILLLGGGPPVQTLETELYERIRYGTVDFPGAMICACWELLITLIPWLLVLFFQRKQRTHIPLKINSRPHVRQRTLPRTLHQVLILAICSVFIVPYFSVLNHKVLSFFWDAEFRSQIVQPLCISLELAVTSGLGAVVTAVAALLTLQGFKVSQKSFFLKGFLSVLLGLPSGISILVLSLGVWLAYGKWIDPFEGSFWIVAALQMTLFFPIVFRILWPVAQKVQTTSLEMARSLGASPLQAFWQVEWPRWKTPLITSFAMAAGASLGELGAVSFFYSEKLISLPLLVSRWMNQYRFEDAQGLAGILLFLSCLTACLAVGKIYAD